jgi:hypothetical protein
MALARTGPLREGEPVKTLFDRSAARASVVAGLAVGLLLPSLSWAVSEYQVKAAFLLNFGKYVEWPSASVGDAIDICVLGRDPFGSTLDETLAGHTVDGRQVKPRRLSDVSQARGCNILFVSRAAQAPVDAVLSRLAGAPVLLVGEQNHFARQGGMINFVEVDNKVRFEINEAAAKKAGLKISSQLLKLATIVEGG